jgi:hypothetical protein
MAIWRWRAQAPCISPCPTAETEVPTLSRSPKQPSIRKSPSGDTLKKRATGRASSYLNPEPRYLTRKEVEQIVKKVTPSEEFSNQLIDELRTEINDALHWYRIQSIWRAEPTTKQLFRQMAAFQAAMLRLKRNLPDQSSKLFEYISELGEYNAELRGPHPRLDNFRLGWESEDEPPPLPPDIRPATSYRSRERLQDLIDCVGQVSEWLSHRAPYERGPWTPSVSPAVLLTGCNLPRIYETLFKRKFGMGRKSPGTRFVCEVLRLSKISGIDYSPDAVVKNQQRARTKSIETINGQQQQK